MPARLWPKTGETLTEPIIHELEERLERLKGHRTVSHVAEEILKISLRCWALPDRDERSPDVILGYDERGGPTIMVIDTSTVVAIFSPPKGEPCDRVWCNLEPASRH